MVEYICPTQISFYLHFQNSIQSKPFSFLVIEALVCRPSNSWPSKNLTDVQMKWLNRYTMSGQNLVGCSIRLIDGQNRLLKTCLMTFDDLESDSTLNFLQKPYMRLYLLYSKQKLTFRPPTLVTGCDVIGSRFDKIDIASHFWIDLSWDLWIVYTVKIFELKGW